MIICWIGLQFDWMGATEWIQKDLSSNPVIVSIMGGTADFGKFDFQVPSDVTVGYHNVTVSIKGVWDWQCSSGGYGILEIEPHADYWSESYTVKIHNIKELEFYFDQPSMFQKLTEARAKTYLSSGAKDLLQQAESKYSEAVSLTGQNKWSEAYEALQLTQSLLNRIPSEENKFIMLVAGSSVGVIAIIGVVIYLVKKRKRTLGVAVPSPKKKEEIPVEEPPPISVALEVSEPPATIEEVSQYVKEIEKFRNAISVLDSQFATKRVSEESYRMAKASLEKKLQDLLKLKEDITRIRKHILDSIEREGIIGKADILRGFDISSEIVDEAFRQLENEGIIEETSGKRYRYKGITKQCPYCRRSIPADLPVCPLCGAVIE